MITYRLINNLNNFFYVNVDELMLLTNVDEDIGKSTFQAICATIIRTEQVSLLVCLITQTSKKRNEDEIS